MVALTDVRRRMVHRDVPAWMIYPPEKVDKDQIIADQKARIEQMEVLLEMQHQLIAGPELADQ